MRFKAINDELKKDLLVDLCLMGDIKSRIKAHVGHG